MEKLQNSKFHLLENEEMGNILGGLGWHWRHSTVCADPNDGSEMTIHYFEYHNIFGPTGKIRESYD